MSDADTQTTLDPIFGEAGRSFRVAGPDMSAFTGDAVDRAEILRDRTFAMMDALDDVSGALDAYSDPSWRPSYFDPSFTGAISNFAFGAGWRQDGEGYVIGVCLQNTFRTALAPGEGNDMKLVEETGRSPALARDTLRALLAAAAERIALSLAERGFAVSGVELGAAERKARSDAVSAQLESLTGVVRSFQSGFDNFQTIDAAEREAIVAAHSAAFDAGLTPFFHVDAPVYDRRSGAMLFVRDGGAAIGPFQIPSDLKEMLDYSARYGDFLGVARDGDTDAFFGLAQAEGLKIQRRRPSLVVSPAEYVAGSGYELRIDPRDGRMSASIEKPVHMQSFSMGFR